MKLRAVGAELALLLVGRLKAACRTETDRHDDLPCSTIRPLDHGSEEITKLAHRAREGDEQARSQLWQTVHEELRKLAGAAMARERAEHTLQPTALVHEAYLRLFAGGDLPAESRTQFYGAAAQAMRRILIEHARKLRVRGGGELPEPAVDTRTRGNELEADVEALARALDRLEADPRQARKCQVVKLRFFAGASVEEVARMLEVSEPTVKRDWRVARAWLLAEMQRGEQS